MFQSKRTEKWIKGFGLLYENDRRQAVFYRELTNVSYFYLYKKIKRYSLFHNMSYTSDQESIKEWNIYFNTNTHTLKKALYRQDMTNLIASYD